MSDVAGSRSGMAGSVRVIGLSALSVALLGVLAAGLATAVSSRRPLLGRLEVVDLDALPASLPEVSMPQGTRLVGVRVWPSWRVGRLGLRSALLLRGSDGPYEPIGVLDSWPSPRLFCPDRELTLERSWWRWAGSCSLEKGNDPFLGRPVISRVQFRSRAPVFAFTIPEQLPATDLSLIFSHPEVLLPARPDTTGTLEGVEVRVSNVSEDAIGSQAKFVIVRLEIDNRSPAPYVVSGGAVALVAPAGRAGIKRYWLAARHWPGVGVEPDAWIPLTDAGVADVTGARVGEELSSRPAIAVPAGEQRSIALPFLVAADLEVEEGWLAVSAQQVRRLP